MFLTCFLYKLSPIELHSLVKAKLEVRWRFSRSYFTRFHFIFFSTWCLCPPTELWFSCHFKLINFKFNFQNYDSVLLINHNSTGFRKTNHLFTEEGSRSKTSSLKKKSLTPSIMKNEPQTSNTSSELPEDTTWVSVWFRSPPSIRGANSPLHCSVPSISE